MLAWLLTFVWLISASLVPTSLKLNSEIPLSVDVLMSILWRLGFADLYHASYASKGIRMLVDQAIRGRCCIQHDNKLYLNYTVLLHELDKMAQDVGEGLVVAEANKALEALPPFRCIQFMLEAEFGYCIVCTDESLPKYDLNDIAFDIVNDKKQVSLLPYVLDHNGKNYMIADWIHELVRLGRFDLLGHMTFEKIDLHLFQRLISIPLPESMLLAAVKGLQRNEPNSPLSSVLSLTIFGGQTAELPENCQVPLYLVAHMYGKGVAIPVSCTLIDGLHEASIGFWTRLLKRATGEFEVLLTLVLQQGDAGTKLLAKVFHEFVPRDQINRSQEMDVFQAMLIRFRFSPHCNRHVTHSYEQIIERPLEVGHNTMCALLDCQQYALLDRCDHAKLHGGTSEEPIIDRMYRLNDANLAHLMTEFVGKFNGAARLLKSMIKRNAAKSHVEHVWNSIQSISESRGIIKHGCSAPLFVLRRFACEPDVLTDDAQKMLSILDGFNVDGVEVSREVHILYTAMYWEASEKVLQHFLDQIPSDYGLDCAFVSELAYSKKYSVKFCAKLMRRTPREPSHWQLIFQDLRPDLAKELGL